VFLPATSVGGDAGKEVQVRALRRHQLLLFNSLQKWTIDFLIKDFWGLCTSQHSSAHFDYLDREQFIDALAFALHHFNEESTHAQGVVC